MTAGLLYRWHDGGRLQDAQKYKLTDFYKDPHGGCVCRAIAIATNRNYRGVWVTLKDRCEREGHSNCHPDKGVCSTIYRPILREQGFEYISLRKKAGVQQDKAGRYRYNTRTCPTLNQVSAKFQKGVFIIETVDHLFTIINGVQLDTWQVGSRTRVEGYWFKKGSR